MKVAYRSCDFCGIVYDVEILKQKEERKSQEQMVRDYSNGSYDYCDYGSVEYTRCPCCKSVNNR